MLGYDLISASLNLAKLKYEGIILIPFEIIAFCRRCIDGDE